MAAPDLISEESVGSGDKTINLKIDLGVAGQTAMTSVFAPDPKQLGAQLDVLIWFAGHKSAEWAKKNYGVTGFDTYTSQQYLSLPPFKLREEILNNTKKRKFVLVVPTTGVKSQPGSLVKDKASFSDFLQKVLEGVQTHMKATTVAAIGNVFLGAHSGGGKAMNTVAGFIEPQIQEIWCFDCTYEAVDNFIDWAKKNPVDKLWVYSLGMEAAHLTKEGEPESPDNKMIKRSGTGDLSEAILLFAQNLKKKTGVLPPVEVHINYGVAISEFNWVYKITTTDHNGTVKIFFAKLVSDAKKLL